MLGGAGEPMGGTEPCTPDALLEFGAGGGVGLASDFITGGPTLGIRSGGAAFGGAGLLPGGGGPGGVRDGTSVFEDGVTPEAGGPCGGGDASPRAGFPLGTRGGGGFGCAATRE